MAEPDPHPRTDAKFDGLRDEAQRAASQRTKTDVVLLLEALGYVAQQADELCIGQARIEEILTDHVTATEDALQRLTDVVKDLKKQPGGGAAAP